MKKNILAILMLLILLTACKSSILSLDDVKKPLKENYIFSSDEIKHFTLADLIEIYGDEYTAEAYMCDPHDSAFINLYTFPDGSRFVSVFTDELPAALQIDLDNLIEYGLPEPVNLTFNLQEDISPENINITSADIYTKDIPFINNMQIGTAFDEIINSYTDFDVEKNELYPDYGSGNGITLAIDNTMGYPYKIYSNASRKSYQSMRYIYDIEENLDKTGYINYTAEIRYYDDKPSAIIWNDYPKMGGIVIAYFDENNKLFKYSFGVLDHLTFLSKFLK